MASRARCHLVDPVTAAPEVAIKEIVKHGPAWVKVFQEWAKHAGGGARAAHTVCWCVATLISACGNACKAIGDQLDPVGG